MMDGSHRGARIAANYLDLGVNRTFIGVNMMKSKVDNKNVYCVDQNADMRASLSEHPVVGAPVKSPMRDRNDLCADTTPVGKSDTTWFRSVLMSTCLRVV